MGAVTVDAGDGLGATEPLEPFGLLVRDWDFSACTPERGDLLVRALADHHVLVFRGHPAVADADLVRWARRFGSVDESPFAMPRRTLADRGFPEIYVVSNITENGDPIGIGRGASTLNWHSDYAFEDRVSCAGLLDAVELPASGGGDTSFCDMYAVFDALPPGDRDALRHATVLHQSDASYVVGDLATVDTFDKVHPIAADDDNIRRAVHPALVANPHSGRVAVYVNPSNVTAIDGVDEDTSARVLDAVFSRLGDPAFTLTHRWEVGDLVIWDQLGLNHARTSFDNTERRYLRQITVVEDSGKPVFLGD
ncbi:MAG TPA: TauD/TfdA family dioxygenase [Acidimicrobiales bacterium]|nr:TauD/TfdA family dioxygenase [Acidimicrobiales bacterium]